MPEWYETRAKALIQDENGLIKAETVDMLVDALSFTEAESKTLNEMEGHKGVEVTHIKRSKIREAVPCGDSSLWWSVKVTYLVEEESAKEKRLSVFLLMNAETEVEASERTRIHLKEMTVSFEVVEVRKTKIRDVIQHVSGLRYTIKKHQNEN